MTEEHGVSKLSSVTIYIMNGSVNGANDYLVVDLTNSDGTQLPTSSPHAPTRFNGSIEAQGRREITVNGDNSEPPEANIGVKKNNLNWVGYRDIAAGSTVDMN